MDPLGLERCMVAVLHLCSESSTYLSVPPLAQLFPYFGKPKPSKTPCFDGRVVQYFDLEFCDPGKPARAAKRRGPSSKATASSGPHHSDHCRPFQN